MYNAVVPLWHSKAKIEEAQGYSERSFCEQFRMQWTQRHMVQKGLSFPSSTMWSPFSMFARVRFMLQRHLKQPKRRPSLA